MMLYTIHRWQTWETSINKHALNELPRDILWYFGRHLFLLYLRVSEHNIYIINDLFVKENETELKFSLIMITYLIISATLRFAIRSTLFLPWANTGVFPLKEIEHDKSELIIAHEHAQKKMKRCSQEST